MKKTCLFVFVVLGLCLQLTCTFAQGSIIDFYKAQEKALKDPNQLGGGVNKVIPIKKDVKNGFISYKTDPPLGFLVGATDARTDMGYFVAKNGKKFSASASMTKIEGMGWSGDMPTFYKLVKGELIDITREFISVEKNTEIMSSIPEGMVIYSKIPQIGTTIEIGTIDPKKGESSFRIMYQMLFDVNNGTFKIVKK